MAASSEDLSREIARLADDKLGEGIVCLDMRELVTYTDYLVICTARNERQAEAIAEDVHLRLKQDQSLLPVNPDRSIASRMSSISPYSPGPPVERWATSTMTAG